MCWELILHYLNHSGHESDPRLYLVRIKIIVIPTLDVQPKAIYKCVKIANEIFKYIFK
jgi:hypothetical protein